MRKTLLIFRSRTFRACLVHLSLPSVLCLAACEAHLSGPVDVQSGAGASTGDGDSAQGSGSGNGSSTADGGGTLGTGGTGGDICVGAVCVQQEPGEPPYNGPGEVPMRRLNVVEYENTTADLFGASPTDANYPADASEDGFDTLDSALAVSEVHVEAWLQASEAIVEELFTTDPAGIAASFCDFDTVDDAANVACGAQIVRDFAELAWRRPLSEWTDGAPLQSYLEMVEAADGHLLADFDLETRLRTALSAILVSPRFVHRVELADAEGQLDSASLASRLSYFLWSSAPDAELLSSDLRDPLVLAEQASRLQRDTRFSRFTIRFPSLWLHLEKLDHAGVDTTVYPEFSEELGEKMKRETLDFLAGFIGDPARPVPNLLTAKSSNADTDLVALYGDSPRSGLVTQASILTLTGAGNRTSPVRRGMWVLESLLCAPPPDPPAELVAQIQEEQANNDPDLNQRDRLAIHRSDPSCFSCHETMDAIGLGLENYDAIGKHRTSYPNGSSVDPSGVLPGLDAPFNTAEELLALLAEDERIPGCVVEKLFTYGAGRKVDLQDDALIETIAELSGGPVMSFSAAISGVATSDGFVRRVEKTEEEYLREGQ